MNYKLKKSEATINRRLKNKKRDEQTNKTC